MHTLGDISFILNLDKKYTYGTFDHISCLEPRISTKIEMQYHIVTTIDCKVLISDQ